MGNEAVEFEVVVLETVTYKLRVKANRSPIAEELAVDSVMLEPKISDERVSCIHFSHKECKIVSIAPSKS